MRRHDPDSAVTSVVGIAERYERGLGEPHAHVRAQIMFAMTGSVTVLAESGSWLLPPSRALWIPGGTRHALKVGTVADIRTLYVAPNVRGRARWSTCVVLNVSPLLRELILSAAAIPWDKHAVSSADERLTRVLFDQLVRAEEQALYLPQPRDPRARRFAAYMSAYLDDRRPLKTLAAEAGLSERTLERVFLSETGLGAGEWVLQMRLISAIEMLSAGRAVGDVAHAVGYQNPSSFIAAFRRAFRTTPGRYFSTQSHPRSDH